MNKQLTIFLLAFCTSISMTTASNNLQKNTSDISFTYQNKILQKTKRLSSISHKSTQTKHFTKITVASWNIGHFALGKDKDTKITAEVFDKKKADYTSFLNSIHPDLIAVIEYNPLFVNATEKDSAISAREAIFSNYKDAKIGTKYDYNCNAIFSNGFPIKKQNEVIFNKSVQTRYYLCVNILMDGDIVKVVSTHLDWNQGKEGATDRMLQIQELIKTFQNDKYVILCADWNTDSPNEFDAFQQAGYRMANHGYLGDIATYPAGENMRRYFDNIIVKGFALNNINILNRPDLSDHCLIKADLIKLP